MENYHLNTHNNNNPNHKHINNNQDNDFIGNNQNYMLLKLFIDYDDQDFIESYKKHIDNHNNKTKNNIFFDSGFDILNPINFKISKNDKTTKYNLKIKTAAFNISHSNQIPSPYYVYPRSSIYKTPIRLANSVGIIDTGYRGNLCALIDIYNNSTNDKDYIIEKGSRLFQICSPNLNPIIVQIVNSEDELGITSRGSGGFGSTGK
tara:strand:- start:17 stop:631 length:615 start_codon:yes stop_codon:yes gene_type:complete